MRYFVRCKYNGTEFHGWQSQKNTPDTVQGKIEEALAIFMPDQPEIVGCGRTDTGVHASEYYFHFDSIVYDIGLMKYKMNSILPFGILVSKIHNVHHNAHARFDATKRAYEYHLVGERDPFREFTSYVYPTLDRIRFEDLQAAAQLLLNYEDFEPFCKNGSDEKTKKCRLFRSEWTRDEHGYTYHVEANRFLRGMIRLIVGMCLNVARGKVTLEEVKEALDNRSRLKTDWSVSARGLYLSKIEYPYLKNDDYIAINN